MAVETLLMPFSYFLNYSDRVYWLYLLSSLTLATVVFVLIKERDYRNISLVDYMFSIKTLCHRYAVNDYFFFYANVLFHGAFVVVFFHHFQLLFPVLY